MQRALKNLAPGLTTGSHKLSILGSTGNALNAAHSAFTLSSLNATWAAVLMSVANFATFFGTGGNLSTAILMMNSDNNIGGGVSGTAVNPYSNAINTCLGAGGSLFSGPTATHGCPA